MAHSTLDDVDSIILTTQKAILVRFKDMREIWIPRSVCEAGHDLDKGDRDVVVADWYIEREGLD